MQSKGKFLKLPKISETFCRKFNVALNMIDLRTFRKVNGLTQDELGQFLGMKKSFISKIEHGKDKFPNSKFQKLMNNDQGWDVSMLKAPTDQFVQGDNNMVAGDSIHQNGGKGNIGKIAGDNTGELLALRKENELLRQQVEDLKTQNEKYWAMIEKLTTK